MAVPMAILEMTPRLMPSVSSVRASNAAGVGRGQGIGNGHHKGSNENNNMRTQFLAALDEGAPLPPPLRIVVFCSSAAIGGLALTPPQTERGTPSEPRENLKSRSGVD